MINTTLAKVALSVECWQTTGLSKFNICVHGFSFCANVCSRKIALHETISVGANICGLIYNVLIDIVFPVYFVNKLSDEDLLNTNGFCCIIVILLYHITCDTTGKFAREVGEIGP